MIESIVALLNVIAGWIEKYRRKRQEEANQLERNDVEEDPVMWFDAKFGGLPKDNADQANSPDTNKKP